MGISNPLDMLSPAFDTPVAVSTFKSWFEKMKGYSRLTCLMDITALKVE